jgi:hypothetical protein
MSEFFTIPYRIASGPDAVWQRQLDALICGECSEDDFMDELTLSLDAGPDSAWNVVAWLDQRYRLG